MQITTIGVSHYCATILHRGKKAPIIRFGSTRIEAISNALYSLFPGCPIAYSCMISPYYPKPETLWIASLAPSINFG